MKKLLIFLLISIPFICSAQYRSGDNTVNKGNEKSTYNTIETSLLIGGNSEVVKDTIKFDKFSSTGLSYRVQIISRHLNNEDFGYIYGGSIGIDRSNLNVPNFYNISVTNYSFQGMIGVGNSKIYGGFQFGSMIPDVRKYPTVYNFGLVGSFQTEIIRGSLSAGLNMNFGFKTNNQYFQTGTDFFGVMGLTITKIFRL